MIAPVRQSAPAKLNLTLSVLGRRADGFHELVSLVAFAKDIADDVTFTPGGAGNVTFGGPFGAALRSDRTNTVAQTLNLLAEPLILGDIVIEKNIPLASGLGGGSTDAAAVLRAVRQCNPGHQQTIDWEGVARQIGADVPVCLASRVQMMSGVGDWLEPVETFPKLFTVLIKSDTPPISAKTQRVFEALNAKPWTDAGQQHQTRNTATFTGAQDVAAFIRQTGNTLLTPARALMPSLEAPLAALESHTDCLAASLSGAGPTVFGVFADQDRADTAARNICAAEPAWWVKVSELV